MSPQRPGNENFPANQVVAPVAQEVGLQYQPWFGTDDDDLEYPTINVHYDFEPKDWNRKKDELRDRIALRRERNKFLANVVDQDRSHANCCPGKGERYALQKAVTDDQRMRICAAAGGTARKLPEALRTGTGQPRAAMASCSSS
ncbi:hypothetical protein CSUI_009706 [Cystoisospora suis]|uniref:Uncharacterized protein n=1 Tax=Cystoisospora suis TaxID=483139 RepID=A0A2C6KG19_9APIC|nr:hypothetical protein CSUI_009706 [Cystoisospora suis]